MLVIFSSIKEEKAGEIWAALFEKTWPAYKTWFLKEGHLARPGYLSSRNAIDQYMPELIPTYDELCELSGGSDLSSRFLSMYCPPPFMSGCTQVAWTKNEKALIRNYDYNPRWFEGIVYYSNWLKPVIGISDCNWGLLDGMNASGLCASLTFGGKKSVGKGFGIPLIIRYLLETCDTVEQACKALKVIPVHMAYNVMLLDQSGDYATVFLGPDRKAKILKSAVCSNHQEKIEWPEYAEATATSEREKQLKEYLNDEDMTCNSLQKRFLIDPLYNHKFEQSFGTLYTASWFPEEGKLRLLWPGKKLEQSFKNFKEQENIIKLNRKMAGKIA
ncbi:MAG TPA: C45 family autoproteolytic acyltransferase/hydrolase [Bacteroidia bacterium]|nr:C45 family autoproteolytic acyltransferase/hydrolase [Bacteroidia bacterium]